MEQAIVALSLEDLADLGFDVSAMTPEEFAKLCDRFTNALIENGLWDILKLVCEGQGLKKLNE